MQAQKMESIGRLAGGIAHDLNNTLSVILGYSELIMDRIPSHSKSSEDLRAIINSVTSSKTIVNQLLAFARRQTIAPRIIDINREIRNSTRMLKGFIGENIELSWRPSESPLKINMDPSQLGQILTNLMLNSRDAIDDNGKITIETKAVFFDENICEQNPDLDIGEYVCLSVTDDGCGMNERVREHLFEPFFTTKDVGEGSGLGLATVYGIVRQNNGSIRVYSEEGYGTTIKIYFPQCKDEAAFQGTDTISGIPEGNGETILVVEDDTSILSMVEQMLSSLGYSVLTAERPEDAIGIVRDNTGRIQLLITDVIMPGMNGRVLSREVVSMDEDITTLFISGYTANAIVKKGVLDKDVDFLGKPFSIGQLARTVHSLLKAKGS